MRYYHYVSDTKVDMLFQQIPQAQLKGLSGEIGFDLFFLKGKVQASCASQETRFAKLRAVETYLEKSGLLPGYLKANTWARFNGAFRMATFDAAPNLVGFFGLIQDMHVFLGGSINHLIAQSGPKTVSPPVSAFASMIRELDKVLKHEDHGTENRSIEGTWKNSGLHDAPKLPNLISRITGKFTQDYFEKSLVFPSQLSIVARVFDVQDVRHQRPLTRSIIGSPLYVADA
jgi:hypothetical protein